MSGVEKMKFLKYGPIAVLVTIYYSSVLGDDWLRSVPEFELTDHLGDVHTLDCLLYTSPSPRDATLSRMPSSA